MNTNERFWAKVDKRGDDDCWEWTSYRNRKGYGGLCRKGRSNFLAHRAAWEIAYGEIPDGLCVLHRCDNPPCVNPSHLWLGTNADNVADRESKGRNKIMYGEAHGMAKLTIAQVETIRASSTSLRELAAQFGVSKSLVSQVRRGDIWVKYLTLAKNGKLV